MDAAVAEPTIGQALPWVNLTFDYTEQIAELIPEDMLDWRPEDPSGKWSFSLGEIAMHCADARLMFARQLSGNESTEGYWSEGPGEDGVWPFKQRGSRQEILDSLKAAREELEPYLNQPVSAMSEQTEGTRAVFDKTLQQIKEAGRDTAEHELRGPANILRVVMAAACHEAGHRGALQTLLRQQGVNAGSHE